MRFILRVQFIKLGVDGNGHNAKKNWTGAVDRQLFFLHLSTCQAGGRECQVSIDSGEVPSAIFQGKVHAVDPAMGQLTLLCDKVPVTLDFSKANTFSYFDYNDGADNLRMRDYFEAGFAAWLEANFDSGVKLSLLLRRDLFFPGEPEYRETEER